MNPFKAVSCPPPHVTSSSYTKLHLDSIEDCEWITMDITNLAAVLEYGRSSGVLRKTQAFGEKKEKETEKP